MLLEESQHEINKNLAIMFTVNMLCTNGLKKTFKDIDSHKDPDVRLYFRSLVSEAITVLKEDNINIEGT
jgi:hypothetical protein